jgi:hypothetical protein
MSNDTVQAPAAAIMAAVNAFGAQNDQSSKKLKYSASDTTIMAGTDNPNIMDKSNSAVWLAFRTRVHNGLREVSQGGISLWHMLCKEGAEHNPLVTIATYA